MLGTWFPLVKRLLTYKLFTDYVTSHFAILLFQHDLLLSFRGEPLVDRVHSLLPHAPALHHDEDHFLADVLEDAIQQFLFQLAIVVVAAFPVHKNLEKGELLRQGWRRTIPKDTK